MATTAAAPHRNRTPADEAKGIEMKVDGGAGPSGPGDHVAADVARPSKPIELPSDYYKHHAPASSSPPVAQYEGENCSGGAGATGGYYDDVYVGDDDDDDDDDTTPPVTSGDDDDDDTAPPVTGDDDDDDDDDDDGTVRTMSAHKTAMRTPAPHHSPVSRLALVGVLLAFPLRRRGTLAGHARRRHRSE